MSDILNKEHIPVIMVADDDTRIREVLSNILEQEGYRVVEAKDGNTVIKIISSEEVDVVLLDINMPGMNGIDVTRRLKSDDELKLIPIVIVTGEKELKLRLEALKAGADDFLIKPPHFAELSTRVKSLLKVKAYNDHQRNYRKILEKQVAERTEQLQMALSEIKNTSLYTIHHLSRAAEYKDEDTAIHIQRMSSYAAAIAEKMELSKEDVELILYTSSMHDIGKIGIPDSILLKKGKLDSDEWKQMQKHTLIGAEILDGSNNIFIRKGKVIALSHHEKWDGTGYPKGLKGKEIPLEGRICAVADVFDALTTQRPYKEAFSLEKAVEIISEGRAKHFDPDITDAFLAILNRITDIMHSFKQNVGMG